MLIGVTSLMKKYGLGADYSGIPVSVLNKAAERGSAIHALLEDYDNGKTVSETPELKAYRKLGLRVLASEYLVSDNDVVASSIDKVLEAEDGYVDLADIKTTSTFHADAVGVQLGIYAYLFEMQNPGIKVRNCYGVHVRNGKAKLVLVERWPEGNVKELIRWERDGVNPSDVKMMNQSCLPTLVDVIGDDDARMLVDAETHIAQAKAIVKAYEDKAAALRDRLICWMRDNHVSSVECSGGTFKMKDEYVRESVDSKKLKEQFPDVASACIKTSIVRASISFINK